MASGSRPTSSGRGLIWHRLITAALLNGDELRAGLTTSALLERTGSAEFREPLLYKDGVKTALREMRAPELGYFVPSPPGQQGMLLGPGLGLVIGASLGSRSCRAVLVHPHGWLAEDADGRPYTEMEAPLEGQLHLPPAQLVERLAQPIRRLLRRAMADPNLVVDGKLPLLGVAAGWPSALHHNKRPAGSALSHEAWDASEEGVHQLLAVQLGLPVSASHALNDTNAAGLWVAWKVTSSPTRETVARRAEVILCLRLSGAIGASGVILPVPQHARRPPFLDSSLIEGKTGVAGELAHLQMPASMVREIEGREPRVRGLERIRGVACSCGRRTCLESFAGGAALLDRLQRSGLEVQERYPNIGAEQLSEVLATTTNRMVDRSLKEIGRLVGLALAGPVLMLNPRSVTLTGSLAGPFVRDGVLAEQALWSHPHDNAFDVLLPGDHDQAGDPAWMVAHGAALAVLRGRLYRRLWPADGEAGLADMHGPRASLHMVGPDDVRAD